MRELLGSLAFSIAVVFPAAGANSGHPTAPHGSPPASSASDQTLDGSATARTDPSAEAIAEYPFVRAVSHAQPDTQHPVWMTRDATRSMLVLFDDEGVTFAAGRTDAASRSLGLHFRGFGRESCAHADSSVCVSRAGDRIEYHHLGIDEWYTNDARGLSQGFTIDSPPDDTAPTDSRSPIQIQFAVSGGLRSKLDADACGITFIESDGTPAMRCSGLAAWDACGRELRATLAADDCEMSILVDDADAAYPITIDPLFAVLQAFIEPADLSNNDMFGSAAAASGDTVVIGSPNHGTVGGSGAVYVYTKSGSTWSLQAELGADPLTPSGMLGASVAIDGDVLVAGAPASSGAVQAQGAAYVFVRNGTAWTQQAQVFASDGAHDDYFGWSVGISGGTIAVGARLANLPGFNFAGAAYVFVQNGTTWTQQAKLVAGDPHVSANFGVSIAASGDSVAVGASGVTTVMPSDGAAYVFTRSGTTWSQQAKLTANDPINGAFFGSSIALDTDTVLVGAFAAGTGPSFQPGAGYVFVRSGASWTLQAKLTAPDTGSFDELGSSASLSGDIAVLGAPRNADIDAQSIGSAYVYIRTGTVWSQLQKLPGIGSAHDMFGAAVGIGGSAIAVGANAAAQAGHSNEGRAFIYYLSSAFEVFCPGDGSGTPCPCGNNSAPGQGRGCTNSVPHNAGPTGGRLIVSGEPSIGADTIELLGSQMYNGTALYFQANGRANGGMGIVYGDGLLCAAGGAVRFGATPNVNGASMYPNAVQTIPVSIKGHVVAGNTYAYQIWYRDPVVFCNGATFNFTNGLKITWAP
jgi:hypothetical protein